MRIIFIVYFMALIQGPVQAFNPIKSTLKIPFSISKFAVKKTAKLAFNIASAPVKMALPARQKAKPKHAALGNIASFMMKNAPYKDLALVAL